MIFPGILSLSKQERDVNMSYKSCEEQPRVVIDGLSAGIMYAWIIFNSRYLDLNPMLVDPMRRIDNSACQSS